MNSSVYFQPGKSFATKLLGLAFTMVSLLPHETAAQNAPAYEPAPVFSAGAVLSPEILAGGGFKIKDQVSAEGMLYSFTIWTPQGWYNPQSLDLLRVRLAEIHALNTLTAMQQDPLFLEGVGDQVTGTVESTVDAVKHPLKTLVDIPLGLGKFGAQVHAKVQEGDTLPDENIRGIHEAPNANWRFPWEWIPIPTMSHCRTPSTMLPPIRTGGRS